MKVLIGFSRSDELVRRLRYKGVDAFTCDLRPADHPWHIQGSIWDVVDRGIAWDWAVFHPMCTYLTVACAWAFNDPDYKRYPGVGYHQKLKPGTLFGKVRRGARDAAIADVKRLWALPFPKAIENPGKSFLANSFRKPTQLIQPYQFGDNASKLTGLWIDGLPNLVPTKRVRGRMVGGLERFANQTDSGQNKLGPGSDRWTERSKPWPGICAAMAEQWTRR